MRSLRHACFTSGMSETAVLTSTQAARRLADWRDVATWVDYTADEFAVDEFTRRWLEHVAVCIYDEAERRFATQAGLAPAVVV